MTGSLLVLLQSLLFQISFPRLGHLSTVGMQSSRSFSVTLYIKLYVPITGIVYFSETCYFHQMPFRDLRKSVHLDRLFLKINQLHSSTSIITTEGKCDLMNGKIQELQQHCPEFSFLIFVFFFLGWPHFQTTSLCVVANMSMSSSTLTFYRLYSLSLNISRSAGVALASPAWVLCPFLTLSLQFCG